MKPSNTPLEEASCDRETTTVSKSDARFNSLLTQLFSAKNFDGQCKGKKGGVDIKYARNYMRPRATVIAWYGRPVCLKKGGCSCGFGLGFSKYVKELDESVFYIDLVCSQEKKGGKILASLEAYAKKTRAKMVALRAAIPALIQVYEKRGYHRVANACVPPSRAGRIMLRDMDRFAGLVGPQGEGVFTDGVRVANTAADAWRAVRKKAPTKSRSKQAELPTGWHFEGGGHGYWMTKCL